MANSTSTSHPYAPAMATTTMITTEKFTPDSLRDAMDRLHPESGGLQGEWGTGQPSPTKPGSNVARAATEAAAADTTTPASASWPFGNTISALSGPSRCAISQS